MRFLIIFLSLLCQSYIVYGQSVATLNFHMAVGGDGKYRIGGVITNNSTESIPYGAITYIIIDEKCNPSHAKVADFGPIKPSSELEFNIPVNGKLSSYRILNVSAWNKYGIPLTVEDKTIDIIKSREHEIFKNCSLKNKKL
jgi:hypothetical protein